MFGNNLRAYKSSFKNKLLLIEIQPVCGLSEKKNNFLEYWSSSLFRCDTHADITKRLVFFYKIDTQVFFKEITLCYALLVRKSCMNIYFFFVKDSIPHYSGGLQNSNENINYILSCR